ncbi:MAG: efflux RND transporter periplasmic adaptor subunit [Planctomycetota bacterium]
MKKDKVNPAWARLQYRTSAEPSRWLGGLLLGAFLCGCEPLPEEVAPVPVRVRILAQEDVVTASRFSGSVEPLQTTNLTFKLPGTVQSLYRLPGLDRDVQVGDVLEKGTPIAELDEGDLRRASASAEARVAQLEARVTSARDNLEIVTRVLERFERTSGSVSEVARDDVAAKRVAAAGELAAAEHALADAKVRLDQANDDCVNRRLIVPFDNALVAEKRIESGERKAAHDVAFRLIDVSAVHVTFGVPDTMIGDPKFTSSTAARVFVGLKVRITADAFEGRSLEAEVTKIAPQADARTRTFLTELTLTNPRTQDGQYLLRPGMIVTVHVGAERDRRVMLLPMTAIHRGRSADELIVYEAVTENDREVARARKVSLGGVYDSQVEVLHPGSEVLPDAQVVVTTAERLSDGTVIRVLRENNISPATLSEAK